mgnify:CR=1 FL=1
MLKFHRNSTLFHSKILLKKQNTLSPTLRTQARLAKSMNQCQPRWQLKTIIVLLESLKGNGVPLVKGKMPGKVMDMKHKGKKLEVIFFISK